MLQNAGMVPNVIIDERGNKKVAVIVAVLLTQYQLLIDRLAGSDKQLRLELLF